MDNMDPTLSELGDEFTLGDIDGKEQNKPSDLVKLNVYMSAGQQAGVYYPTRHHHLRLS